MLSAGRCSTDLSCRLPSIFPSPTDRTTNYDPKYEAVRFNPQSDSARPTFWPRQQVHMGPVDKQTASQHSSYRLCCTGTAYASGARQISSHSLKWKSKARLYEASPSSDIKYCNVLSVCQPLYGPTSKPKRRHSSLTQRLAACACSPAPVLARTFGFCAAAGGRELFVTCMHVCMFVRTAACVYTRA